MIKTVVTLGRRKATEPIPLGRVFRNLSWSIWFIFRWLQTETKEAGRATTSTTRKGKAVNIGVIRWTCALTSFVFILLLASPGLAQQPAETQAPVENKLGTTADQEPPGCKHVLGVVHGEFLNYERERQRQRAERMAQSSLCQCDTSEEFVEQFSGELLELVDGSTIFRDEREAIKTDRPTS